MLFAKDLKVALATLVATVGLLGFGTASASVVLNETTATPLYFAKEAYLSGLTTDQSLAVRATSTAAMDGDVSINNVDVLLEVGDTYYFRYDLGGPVCMNPGGSPTDRQMCPNFTGTFNDARPYIQGRYGDQANTGFGVNLTRAGGGQGESYALYALRMEAGATDDDGVLGSAGLIPAGNWSLELAIRDQAYIELPTARHVATVGPVCYTITFSLWEDAGDAQRNGDNFILKTATRYACLIDTVTVNYVHRRQFVNGAWVPWPATATVVSGFTRFRIETGVTDLVATLGTATVNVSTSVGTRTVMHPRTGATITSADVLGTVAFRFSSPSFEYSSPFGFGEFALGRFSGVRYEGDTAQRAADLGNAVGGVARATRAATDNVRMTVSAPDTLGFTATIPRNVNADRHEPNIGQGNYMVSWEIDRPGSQPNPALSARCGSGSDTPTPCAGSRPAGAIMRDGTTVRVGYLTVATDFENADVNNLVEGSGTVMGSYNQRLVITNHSSRVIEWRLGSFVAEPGVTVSPKAGDDWELANNVAVGNIGARGQMVVKMTDLLTVEGGSRTGGILSLSAAAGEVTVVTTQVTRPEGQTDTVRHWPLQ